MCTLEKRHEFMIRQIIREFIDFLIIELDIFKKRTSVRDWLPLEYLLWLFSCTVSPFSGFHRGKSLCS